MAAVRHSEPGTRHAIATAKPMRVQPGAVPDGRARRKNRTWSPSRLAGDVVSQSGPAPVEWEAWPSGCPNWARPDLGGPRAGNPPRPPGPGRPLPTLHHYARLCGTDSRKIHAASCPPAQPKRDTRHFRSRPGTRRSGARGSRESAAFASRELAAETIKTSQTISRAGSRASMRGPAEFFTGDARIDPLFRSNDTANYSGAYVTFEPGARSAWHIHPAGQHIVVTSGVGRTGVWGGKVEEIKAGDVTWCPPGVKHWHGATPNTAMTHLVITGMKDGKNVEWMEKVADAQYSGD